MGFFMCNLDALSIFIGRVRTLKLLHYNSVTSRTTRIPALSEEESVDSLKIKRRI